MNEEEKKSVSEIIEEVKADICQNFCKHPYFYDDEITMREDHCENDCPLDRL